MLDAFRDNDPFNAPDLSGCVLSDPAGHTESQGQPGNDNGTLVHRPGSEQVV